MKDDNPKRVKVKIPELVDTIRNEQPNAKIVLSSIIHRNDDRFINGSIDQVNRAVESVCRQRGMDFISHDNIPGDCLNNGGLHLNRKGVFNLANNFRKHLSSRSNLCFVDVDSHSNRSDSSDFKPFHETMSEMRGFKMGSLNINSLVKHIDKLRVAMINQPLDILHVAINESQL